ncbi:HPr family phosphocarrier protein [Lachnospiraceae bacterium ZAX-1]
MNEKKIKLGAPDEVLEFVQGASKCEFDIDVVYQSIILDAKSFLGIIGLGLPKEITVKYGGEDLAFEDLLGKYVVA